MDKKLGFFEKLSAYHLKTQLGVILILVIITIISFTAYLSDEIRQDSLLANLLLALITSLLASTISIGAETFVSYKMSEKDEFLEDIHSFGVDKLNENKEEAIKELLETCDNEVWITGYRLIMTRSIADNIADVIEESGINVRLLACPPWEDGYKLVYGNDKVIDNYFEIIHKLDLAREKYYINGGSNKRANIEILFTKRPLFNDTYRIDKKLITGPYMNIRDVDDQHMTAKDFFSYTIIDKSALYNLIEKEFETLWSEESNIELDMEHFDSAYKQFKAEDLTDKEKQDLLLSVCSERKTEEMLGL